MAQTLSSFLLLWPQRQDTSEDLLLSALVLDWEGKGKLEDGNLVSLMPMGDTRISLGFFPEHR